MRNQIKKHEEPKLRSSKAAKQPSHRRMVLPLPADAVDAAFTDGVEIDLPHKAPESEPLTYAEVVQNVSQQLDYLETQRKQLQQLLREAAQTLK